jgi:hypothetical protein
MSDANEGSVLERKTPPTGQLDEFTYIPGPEGPVHTTVGAHGFLPDGTPQGGYKFLAHIPQKLPRRTTVVNTLVRQERELPDGQIVSRSIEKRVPLYEILRDNPHFMINGQPPRARQAASARLPSDPDQYRGYAIAWMRDENDPNTIKTRWDGEQKLREMIGVAASDLPTIVSFMEGRLLVLGGARTIPAIPLE